MRSWPFDLTSIEEYIGCLWNVMLSNNAKVAVVFLVTYVDGQVIDYRSAMFALSLYILLLWCVRK